MRELPTIDEPIPILHLSQEETKELSREVRALAAERDAVILAHNYQVPEVQDVADFVGDSLALSRRAAATDASVIAVCGVHFMAETASVLSPGKTVLIPDLDAGCSLADSITANELRNWKSRHPGAVVVMYVNTSAEVKAETDYCCTSSNAVQVVEHIYRERGPDTEILFGPDVWLGSHVERTIRRSMHVWPGECHVHVGIRAEDIEHTRAEHPAAELLIHPECGCLNQVLESVGVVDRSSEGVHVLSTGGMLDYLEEHPKGEFIIATESGMLYPLGNAAPKAVLHAANEKAVCKYMKMITLPKLRDSLREARFEVKVPDEVAERARTPIERMVAIG
jgi:quinolinate synthase